MKRYLTILAALALIVAVSQPAHAQLDLSPDELEQRIGFLEERLEAQKRPAQIWQYGWTGGFAVSAAVNTGLAIAGESRTASTVNALKSLGSLVTLSLSPTPARLGASVMGDPGSVGAEERLSLGKKGLLANANRARTKTGFRRHAIVVAANLIGGEIIYAAGDEDGALISTASGLIIGEAQIWSEPGRAIRDESDYHSRFGKDVGWTIRPGINHVSLVYKF